MTIFIHARTFFLTGVLAAVMALSGMGAPASAASSFVQLPTGNACHTSAAARPATIVLSCADGNVYVGSITWSTWTASGATGAGRFTYNNCAPIDCAGGTFLSVAATLRASAPRTISGQLLFTHLVITKTGIVTAAFDWSSRDGTWNQTVPDFYPATHRVALLALLGTKASGHKISVLTLYSSPLDTTWVLYHASIVTSSGDDNAEGYADFVSGHWVDVFGPASGFCSEPTIPGVPAPIRASLATHC